MSELFREFPDNPKLGRKIAEFDPASLMYGAMGAVASADEPLRSRTHGRFVRAYDQGETSQCVAFSAKGMVNTSPIRASLPSKQRSALDPVQIYGLAQTLDAWEGENYDGTSVLAGAKAMKQLGLIQSYRWCFGADDVLHTLSSYGPVVVGIAWYKSMFKPDEKGLLTVDKQSTLAGGHAIEIIGINTKTETVTMANTWGTSWGDRGRCYLRWTDLAELLGEDGEAVTYQ